MPVIRKDLLGKVMGLASGGLILYDSKTAKDLKIQLSVDITDECQVLKLKEQEIKKVRLDFSKASHDKIVAITKCRKTGSDNGIVISYTLNDLRQMDMTFKDLAKDFSLTPKKLRTIIRSYAKQIK
ncbi:MAG: hypothetical protein ABIJ81_03090 [Patescibacteria group bacterium]